MSHFVTYNALSLWRFYAGAILTVFIMYWYKTGKKVVQSIDTRSSLLFILMTMVLFSAPSHMLVKFRPMQFLPYLSYHFYFGEMGLMILIAYIAFLVHTEFERANLAWLLISLIWFDIILCAFIRPAFLNFAANYSEMGVYPQPMHLLKEYIH